MKDEVYRQAAVWGARTGCRVGHILEAEAVGGGGIIQNDLKH